VASRAGVWRGGRWRSSKRSRDVGGTSGRAGVLVRAVGHEIRPLLASHVAARD
jgi:hypothetical protein